MNIYFVECTQIRFYFEACPVSKCQKCQFVAWPSSSSWRRANHIHENKEDPEQTKIFFKQKKIAFANPQLVYSKMYRYPYGGGPKKKLETYLFPHW